MTTTGGATSNLMAQVIAELRTDEGRRLLEAMLEAHQRGGPRAVKELLTQTLATEKELHEEDAGEVSE